MNYRHAYHAGNFADVVKHTVLLAVLERLQRKDKGLLYLDTHAGRGDYDLGLAMHGLRLERAPEWPDGIGRIEAAAAPPLPVANFLQAVTQYRESLRDSDGRRYPGSPRLVAAALRPQDRMLLAEKHPAEAEVLREAMFGTRRSRVEEVDGYRLMRGALPPLERRALVLIDPPYEAADEFTVLEDAVAEGLRRLPNGTFTLWYPLTVRAGHEEFIERYRKAAPAPAWTAEVTVGGPDFPRTMRGCGLLVINPPWQLDEALSETVEWFGRTLAQAPGAAGGLRWIVAESGA